MEILNRVCNVLLQIFGVLTLYKIVYTVIGFLVKEKPLPPPRAKKTRRYGVVICARNEEAVIGKLIDSIRKQTYDRDKITVFVCADNCSDQTARICREAGCVVYERTDPERARKGYALQFLYRKIEEDYGIDNFDGFFTFDADNLLKEDFIENMDRAFTEESGVLVGYRNTKNFDTNAITAAYGIHFYRSTLTLHRPRAFFGVSTHIAGTGYLIGSKLLKDGWNCVCLTEDTEFTLKAVAAGHRIDFCEQAEFFDEQPRNFFISCRQRIRWAKGRLAAFFYTAHRLVAGLFAQKTLRKKFSCYDLFFYAFPFALFSALLSALYPCAVAILSLAEGTFFASLNLPHLCKLALVGLLTKYLKDVLVATLVCIRERKHIRCTPGKTVFFILTWFWFGLVSLPLAVLSLFLHVKWKPIKHDDAKNIDDLSKEGRAERALAAQNPVRQDSEKAS